MTGIAAPGTSALGAKTPGGLWTGERSRPRRHDRVGDRPPLTMHEVVRPRHLPTLGHSSPRDERAARQPCTRSLATGWPPRTRPTCCQPSLTRSPRRCARRRPGRHGPGADGPRRWHGRRSPPGGRAQRRHALRGRAAPGEPFTAGDQRLLAALAPQVAVIIRVLQPTGSLERERDRVLTEAHPDRHRIRRDLHDGLGPSLTRIGSGLQAVQAQLGERADPSRRRPARPARPRSPE